MTKTLSTQVTVERFFACVRYLVRFQTGHLGESFATLPATVRPLPSVDSLVYFELSPSGEPFKTLVTAVRLLSRVNLCGSLAFFGRGGGGGQTGHCSGHCGGHCVGHCVEVSATMVKGEMFSFHLSWGRLGI